MAQTLKNLVFALIVLMAVLIVLSFAGESGKDDEIVEERVPIGPPSTEVAAQLAKSSGFEFLVSYTDNGFEPASTTLKAGQTIRFINNSRGKLWVAAVFSEGGSRYSGSSDCGGSSLDTCGALDPGEFWEFTFNNSGTWGYQNNLDKEKAAVVEVR